MPKPYTKRARTSTSTTTPALISSTSTTAFTITLKPLRGTPVTITNQTPDASIYDVKAACAAQAGYLPEKVKVLWERKPVSESKTVREVVGEAAKEGAEVEMGVMFVGQPTEKAGGAAEKDKEKEVETAPAVEEDDVWHEAPVAPGQEHGKAVLESDSFWQDLHGFVLQRIKDEAVTKELLAGFKKSWKS